MKKIILFFFLFAMLVDVRAQQGASEDEALAMQFYQDGEFEKVLTIVTKLYNRSRNNTYYDLYFNTLLKLKQFDDAEKLVKAQIKSDPDSYAYQVDYGKLFNEQGEPQKAASLYEDLIKKLPKNEFAISDLANNLKKAQAGEYAVKTFLHGRKLLNNETVFTYELIDIYRLQNNKEMLVQEYLNILSENQQIINPAKAVLARAFQDSADYDMLRTALLRRLQKNPQNLGYEQLLSWVYLQQKDFDFALNQTIALDKRLKEDGGRVYDLVGLFISNKAYTATIKGLQYLIGKGKDNDFYVAARIEMIKTKHLMMTLGKYNMADLIQLEKDYKAIIDEYVGVSDASEAVRQLANLQAFYLNKPKDAQKLLEDLLLVRGLPTATVAQTKIDLGDVYILSGVEWEAALIYGQVYSQLANEPLGQEAKFRAAKLSYYQGDFDWAKVQLDVLKNSTSQLIANDALNLSLLISENTISKADTNALKTYAKADFLIFKSQFSPAIAMLDSINIKYPGNSLTDDILMAKAKIYLKQNELQQAVAQLQNIIDNYKTDLWADDALFTLADLYETKLNDLEKAKSLYEKIILDFPGSLYVIEARKRFRNLRGDKIG